MTLFRMFLVVLCVTLLVYTGLAFINEGPNLFATTIPAIAEFGWQGQFHMDFVTYLLLSGLWVAWRHEFTSTGIVLGIVAANLGIIFLSVYLLVAIRNSNGDMAKLLLGSRRAGVQ